MYSCIGTAAGAVDQAWTGRPGAEGASQETSTEHSQNANIYLNCM